MRVLRWLLVGLLLRQGSAFGIASGMIATSSAFRRTLLPSPSPRGGRELRTSRTRTTRSPVLLDGRHHRPYISDDGDDGGGERSRERSTERPTQTRDELVGPSTGPAKPKILVLGASGLIGRRVVQAILDKSHLDVTVVAFVRDYDKACRVLYDDLLVSNSRKRGPKLQIVEGCLIPPEELPGYRGDDEEEERAWLLKAKSAASFYGNSVKDYDNRGDEENIDPYEALEESIRDCTTIISCVGSVRPTNIWTDFLARPFWRLLRKDVSGWCNDPRHPFYVHYHTTRKALHLAEREQLRREAAAAACQDGEEETEAVPRIRFIRISDLCVALPPWQFIPLLTNTLHSMVFRYQDMAEKTLEASSLIETVTLRPGDLVEDERDANTVALQVDTSGSLPAPARVGREDVAALAVAASLFDSKRPKRKTRDDNSSDDDGDEPFHYTLACRWVGEQMDPYPAQGKMSNGLPDATLCIQAALRKLRQDEKRRRRRRALKAKKYPETALRIGRHHSKTSPRKVKPYGVCVAIPVYFVISMILRSLCYYLSPYLPGASYVKPLMNKTSNAVAVALGMILGQLRALQYRLPSLLPNLLRRSCSSQYNIPF